MAYAQKPDFSLSVKRTSPFKSVRASVQSTADSRGVRISGSNGSNAGYTVFQRWCEGYWLPTPFGSFPFTSPPCVTVCRHVSTGLYQLYIPIIQRYGSDHILNVLQEVCMRAFVGSRLAIRSPRLAQDSGTDGTHSRQQIPSALTS